MTTKHLMNSPKIRDAMKALALVIDAELAKTGDAPKTIAIVVKTREFTAVSRKGCGCAKCTVDLLSHLAEASGADVTMIDQTASADRAVH